MPTFTPFLPRRQFLPRQAFYPNFTPFAILCALQLPRFYPRGKTAHFLLVDRPDSPELGISIGVVLAGLHVGQLKMDMPPVFTANRQQNVRG